MSIHLPAADTELYLGPNFPIPLRAAYEYNETTRRSVKVKRKWDGRLGRVSRPSAPITTSSITATGWRRPARLDVGCIVSLHSRDWVSEFILPGEISVVTKRDIVPGTVRIERADGSALPHTVNGRTIRATTVATELLFIFFREVFLMEVTSIEKTSVGGSGDGNWAIELEEVEPVA